MSITNENTSDHFLPSMIIKYITFFPYNNSGGTWLESENKWTLDKRNVAIKNWFLTRGQFVPSPLPQRTDGNV